MTKIINQNKEELALPYGNPVDFELPAGPEELDLPEPKEMLISASRKDKASSEPKKLSINKNTNTVKFPVEKRVGSLIVVEGSDGSGKTTQLVILKQLLEANGFSVLLSEWNSSPSIKPLSKKIKGLFDPEEIVEAETFSMQYAADMYDRYEKQIKGALDAGMIVLCDRYKFTALARDVARGASREFVERVYSLLPEPDLTFFFRVDVATAVERVISRSHKVPKFYEAGMDRHFSDNIVDCFKIFQDKILAEYDGMTEKYGFNVIDGKQPIYLTVPIVRGMVNDYFKKKYGIEIK